MKRLISSYLSFIKEKTLYPIMIGVLFLLNELRQNVLFFTLKETLLLITIIISFTIFVYFGIKKIVKDKYKAGLICSIILFVNFFYLDIYKFFLGKKIIINAINSFTFSHPEIVIIPSLCIISIILIIRIYRSIKIASVWTLYLNLLFVSFIIVEVLRWIILPVTQVKLIENDPLPVNRTLNRDQKPDIFYIILDSYTSSESLNKFWHYNNSDFEDSLRKVGFHISRKSKTFLTSTPYCIASYLNSSELKIDTSLKYNERNLLSLIRENRLSKWLNENGYLTYNYSFFDIPGAKRYYNGFYYNHFLGRTIWYTNTIQLYHYLNSSSRIPWINLSVFKELEKISRNKKNRPIFVYAHLIMPHSPFYFDENGVPFENNISMSVQEKYLRQLIYTNKLTIRTVKSIIMNSDKSPIIIIQGDHGYKNMSESTISEKMDIAHSIFFAIRAPYKDMFSDEIQPENIFKEIVKEINSDIEY